MISTQIRTLLDPPKHDVSIGRAIELLNSNLKLLDDTENDKVLDRLLAEAQDNSEVLNSQLAQSQQNIDALLVKAHSDAQEHLTAAQGLALMRHSLADELASLSDVLVSAAHNSVDGEPMGPTLLEEIETLHRNLKELQSVKGYVEVVHRALALSEQAVKQFECSSASSTVQQGSLTDYKALQHLVSSVRCTCANVEGGDGSGIRLISFLEDILRKTWVSIKDVLGVSLLAAAEKLHWPMPVNYPAADVNDRKAFESAFQNMLVLQELGEKMNAGDGTSKSQEAPEGLYPLQMLVRPVALRFKYHFDGTRQTNRLDKPEWYFAHILNVAHEHHPFMDNIIQRLIRASPYRHINAWREFTMLLLPIISRKIRKSIPAVLPRLPLLAHTIYQALAFDDALREAGFGPTGTTQQSKADLTKEWEGMSEVILGQKEWFEAWLRGERAFIDNQYNEIISAHDAWHIVGDAIDDASFDKNVRPTNSARRIKTLVEQITDRYRPLPRFAQKTRFLIEVQVPVLELYHTRISESLDAFETLSSFLVRAVPGALAGQAGHGTDTKRMTTGVQGVQRLVKAFVSAKWMAGVMGAWGEDVFFLELWHTICERSQLRKTAESNPSLPNPSSTHADDTIFEELIVQYNALADRAEGMIIRQICGEVETELKGHLYKSPTGSEQGSTNDSIISQTLLAPIACLSSHLNFLRKNLPPNIVSSIYRQSTSHISSHILQRAIFYRGRGRMSMQDGKTLLDETNLWIESCRLALGSTIRKPEKPWKTLLESCKLLSLDVAMFQRVVNVVNLGSDSQFEQLKSDLDIDDMDAEKVLDVLRVRDDFLT